MKFTCLPAGLTLGAGYEIIMGDFEKLICKFNRFATSVNLILWEQLILRLWT